ncbi:hypothetical protein SO802_010019 [Lithocarpus litseifolius]|uniref:Retrotransposon gag domain-containing protein n=1 Tax=Lithocarpus litseifolius TaxID=425828 RepID=A0AAW2DDP1_9ROSI
MANSTSNLQPNVIYFKTTRKVWLDLQHRVSQGKEACSLSQEDLTINGYYMKFKGLWDELSDYRTCSCGHQVQECTMSFLMGLNDTYATMRGQILLMDPIPSLSKIFSLLLQDEKQRKVGKRLNTKSLALVVKNSGSFAKGYNKSKSSRPQVHSLWSFGSCG